MNVCSGGDWVNTNTESHKSREIEKLPIYHIFPPEEKLLYVITNFLFTCFTCCSVYCSTWKRGNETETERGHNESVGHVINFLVDCF